MPKSEDNSFAEPKAIKGSPGFQDQSEILEFLKGEDAKVWEAKSSDAQLVIQQFRWAVVQKEITIAADADAFAGLCAEGRARDMDLLVSAAKKMHGNMRCFAFAGFRHLCPGPLKGGRAGRVRFLHPGPLGRPEAATGIP